MSGIWLLDCSKLTKNPKNDNDITVFWHDIIIKFFWRCFVSHVKFSYCSKFHVNIITGSVIMTIFFYRDLPEVQKWEIPQVEFCPISGDWGELWKPILAQMSLIKCYWMLRNARFTAFTVFELLRENQRGGGVKLPPAPPPSFPPHFRVKRNTLLF